MSGNDVDGWIVIDLGRERAISAFDFWPRPDHGNTTPHKKMVVSAAPDARVAAGAPVDAGAFSLVKEVTGFSWTAGKPTRVTFDEPVTPRSPTRFVSFRAATAVLDAWTSESEFSGLSPGVEYYAFARTLEDGDHEQAAMSEPVKAVAPKPDGGDAGQGGGSDGSQPGRGASADVSDAAEGLQGASSADGARPASSALPEGGDPERFVPATSDATAPLMVGLSVAALASLTAAVVALRMRGSRREESL